MLREGMNFKLQTAKPTDKPTLFIQCKGLHSGRPLTKYIPNSFALFSEDPFAFEKCYILWVSKKYQQLIIGSVVPFIRKRDIESILDLGFDKLGNKREKELNQLHLIDKIIEEKTKLLASLNQLKIAYARTLLK